MKQEDRVSVSRMKILEAAVKEFGMKGYKEASTNDICEACGISKGLVFYHFKSKKELFNQCATQCINEFDSFMKENFVKGKTPMEGIKGCCLARKNFFNENPYYFKILCEVLYERDYFSGQNYEVLFQKYRNHNYEVINRILEGVSLNPRISREENIQCAVMVIEAIDIDVMNKYPVIEQVNLMLEEQMQKYEGYLEILFYGILEQ